MEKAETMLSAADFETFEEDYQLNFAVVRALEIVGEATKHLPESLRKQYPEIPWKDMAGMRDRIIHGYDAVNLRPASGLALPAPGTGFGVSQTLLFHLFQCLHLDKPCFKASTANELSPKLRNSRPRPLYSQTFPGSSWSIREYIASPTSKSSIARSSR
jgi:hypothetical protein